MKNHHASFLFVLLVMPALSVIAERNHLKPSDFEPLTSLPWKKEGATLEGVLDAVFREPSIGIRYPVLAEYLRTIPVAKLSQAFDVCLDLEGTQNPDDLVEFFLSIWAKRDPKACWKRTKELFHVVGFEDGWLTFDAWWKFEDTERPRITVQDLNAIRASRFWLTRKALLSFPGGVDQSALPKPERVRIMKEFADTWFRAFGSWPGYPRPGWGYSYARVHPDAASDLIKAFGFSAAELRTYDQPSRGTVYEAAFDVALRRWLQAEPASALKIFSKATVKWPPDQHGDGDSIQLQMIWAKADLPGMICWAESPELRKDRGDVAAKAFLMSRVDAETHDRWLTEMKSEKEDDDRTGFLEEWARWEPRAAIEAMMEMKDFTGLGDIATTGAYGPWGGQPYNTSHFGLGTIKDFDASQLPADYSANHREDWYEIWEEWGDVDIGEAARQGLDFILRSNYAPRENLIRFFSGEEVYPDEGNMIDRTFCALRVWAVFKPKEMKAWIAAQNDPAMQKALTWLLEHPLGGPKK